MARPRNIRPTYRLHKQSGQAIVTLTTPGGRRHDLLLGRYGSATSKIEYDCIVAQWMASDQAPDDLPRRRTLDLAPPDLTINELLLRSWSHAQQHYRHADGRPTSELGVYRRAVRELRELFGHRIAAEFGPLALKTVRQTMIENDVSRKTINGFIGRIRSVFKWAASEELIPASVHQALTTVAGLKRGRSPARETEPVRPVPDAFVNAILDHVSPTVRGMIELQRLTGMRPGEVCQLRPCDIDTTGEAWIYRPPQHKGTWRNRERIVVLGSRAQAVVRRFLTTDLTTPIFSPRREREERSALNRAHRQSRVQPSQVCRKKPNACRLPRESYTKDSYARAVTRGIKKANAARIAAASADHREIADRELVPHWHPNQLRHTHGTEVRRRFGLEAAQVALGHSQAGVTQIYAEVDLNLAVKIAREIG